MSNSEQRSANLPKEKEGIARFLLRTFDIFSNPEFEAAGICGWGPNHNTIVVKKIDEFSNIVLPRYFKKGNYKTFVRQLNMYDFHKTVSDPSNGEFIHKHFHKGRRDMLHFIKRKAYQNKNLSQNQQVPNDDDEDDDAEEENSYNVTTDALSAANGFPPTNNGVYSKMYHSNEVGHGQPSAVLAEVAKEQQKQYNSSNSIATLSEQLRNQKSISEHAIQEIAAVELEHGRLSSQSAMLQNNAFHVQKQIELSKRRLDTACKALYLMQYSNVPQPTIEYGKPTKLIQNIINNKSLPSVLSNGQTRWMEDYAEIVVMSAPIDETLRGYDDNDGIPLVRLPSFDELIRENLLANNTSGMPLVKSHSLFDDSLSSGDSYSYGSPRNMNSFNASAVMMPPTIYTNPKLNKPQSTGNLNTNSSSEAVSPRTAARRFEEDQYMEAIGNKRDINDLSLSLGSKSPRSAAPTGGSSYYDNSSILADKSSADVLLELQRHQEVTLSRINSVDDSYLSFMNPSSNSSSNYYLVPPILPRNVSNSLPNANSPMTQSHSSPINEKYTVV